MRLKNLLNDQKRDVYAARIRKRIRWSLTPARGDAVPVFILGAQRSGTTMLMNAMHLNAHTRVFDESRQNRVFADFRLRSAEAVNDAIRHSKAGFVFFKPLADSHLARTYLDRFPQARIIWMYRHYRDVAFSAIRKWSSADDAIRKVCRGQRGGGWFQEGITAGTEKILRKHYDDRLSGFELRCLVWWARNNLYFEQALTSYPNVMLLNYEDVVSDPWSALSPISRVTGLPLTGGMFRHMHARSIGNKAYPALDDGIRRLCDAQQDRLDFFYHQQRQSFEPHRGAA